MKLSKGLNENPQSNEGASVGWHMSRGLWRMGVVEDGDCGAWGLLEVGCVIWRHRLELGV